MEGWPEGGYRGKFRAGAEPVAAPTAHSLQDHCADGFVVGQDYVVVSPRPRG